MKSKAWLKYYRLDHISFKNSSRVIPQSLKITPNNPTRISFTGTVMYIVSFVKVA